jgi:hypothetical protein
MDALNIEHFMCHFLCSIFDVNGRMGNGQMGNGQMYGATPEGRI